MPFELVLIISILLLVIGFVGFLVSLDDECLKKERKIFSLIFIFSIFGLFWMIKNKIIKHENSEYVLMPDQTELTNITKITGKFYNEEKLKITYKINGWNNGIYFSPAFPKIVSVEKITTVEQKKDQ